MCTHASSGYSDRSGSKTYHSRSKVSCRLHEKARQPGLAKETLVLLVPILWLVRPSILVAKQAWMDGSWQT